MEQIKLFIKENTMGFLSTMDTNNQPRVRGFGIMLDESDTIVFGTSNKRRTFKQISTNPRVEWIGMSKDFKTLRLSGSVEIETDRKKVEAFMKNNPILNKMYGNRVEELELFYLKKFDSDWFGMNQSF